MVFPYKWKNTTLAAAVCHIFARASPKGIDHWDFTAFLVKTKVIFVTKYLLPYWKTVTLEY